MFVIEDEQQMNPKLTDTRSTMLLLSGLWLFVGCINTCCCLLVVVWLQEVILLLN